MKKITELTDEDILKHGDSIIQMWWDESKTKAGLEFLENYNFDRLKETFINTFGPQA